MIQKSENGYIFGKRARSSMLNVIIILFFLFDENQHTLRVCTKAENTYICRFDVALPYCHRREHSNIIL